MIEKNKKTKMTDEIKFRAWNKDTRTMVDLQKITPLALSDTMNTQLSMQGHGGLFIPFCDNLELIQYTGVEDKNGKEIYVSDICEFDNGDRFIVYIQDWLEVGAEWIGDPECEDQMRDFYRAHKSKVIGNIHQNPDLMGK